MDYQDLPVEERISRAAEYAVLLLADGKHVDSIVEELTGMFHLTHQQARQAYEKMRTEHGTAYQTTLHTIYLRALGAAGYLVFCVLFFYFMGSELRTTGLGIALLLLALLAVTQVLDILAWISRHRNEQKRREVTPTFTQNLLKRIFRTKSPHREKAPPPLPPRYLGSKGGKFEAGLISIIGFTGIIVLLLTCNYIKGNGIVDESTLVTSGQKVLYKKPWKEWISEGDDRHFAYYFSFYEDPHLYRFDEDHVKYRVAGYYLDSMEVGDTLTIRYDQEDSTHINRRHTSHIFKIYNIAKDGMDYADLHARNKDVNKNNKEKIWAAVILFTVIAVLYAIIGDYRKWKYKKLIGSRTNTKAG